jgi:very-short-patch-repair endonuclease
MIDKGQRPDSPPLQGRGRGWGLSVTRLGQLQNYAGDMRRNPTEPEKRLWRQLSGAQLGGHKFRRQAVIGSCIVDFLCAQKALIVEVDGDTHDMDRDAARDGTLAELGYVVVRFANQDVMHNMAGVLESLSSILVATPDRWNRPHPNPSPEGEGLGWGLSTNTKAVGNNQKHDASN